MISRRLAPFFNELQEQLVDFATAQERRQDQHTLSSSAAPPTGSIISPPAPTSKENQDRDPASILQGVGSLTKVSLTADTAPDFAMFLDGGGHFAGTWVTGVEKWHTGVMWARRGAGKRCMETWANILASGAYDSDQQALDDAELTQDACPGAMTLSFRHLLFAKVAYKSYLKPKIQDSPVVQTVPSGIQHL